ncbi:MAG TPA: DUF4194 domain-containing protein [Treponemataceae bacterium]|nr:DUF4194 domain-containing protein [Treponemataceae bacterium]
MRPDAAGLAIIGELTDSEFDTFRSCVRLLLSRTFLMRSFEKEERLYEFALRNIRLLELWFSCADIELRRDEGLGVIACRSGFEMRSRLGREETCALLVCRIIYEEERGDIRLSRNPSVAVGDFLRRYMTITGIQPKKTRMADVFRRLSFFRLIKLTSDPADPEGLLILYPSLALALDLAAVEEIETALEKEATARGDTKVLPAGEESSTDIITDSDFIFNEDEE